MTDPALEAHEHAEHAEHAAHANDPFTSRVSITIAVLAVLSASAASLEGFESAGAIIDANQAVLAAKAKDEGAGEDTAQAEAKRLEAERDAKMKESAVHERRHHRLTIGATMLEVGIAIATIAIITRKRWPWAGSAALGVLGAVVALSAYVM